MRISSSQYFNLNVASMSDQQSTLASMYQQISSGKRILTASDDPLGAAQAVQLTLKSGALAQYSTNQTTALSSLQQEDATLSSVSSALQSVQTQIVHAGDGSLTDSDRTAIANTIQGLRDQLFSLANTTDSNGNFSNQGTAGDMAVQLQTQSGTLLMSGSSLQTAVDASQNAVFSLQARAITPGGNPTSGTLQSAINITYTWQ